MRSLHASEARRENPRLTREAARNGCEGGTGKCHNSIQSEGPAGAPVGTVLGGSGACRRGLEYAAERISQEQQRPSTDKILSLADTSAAFIAKGGREAVIGYRPQVARSGQGIVCGLSECPTAGCTARRPSRRPLLRSGGRARAQQLTLRYHKILGVPTPIPGAPKQERHHHSPSMKHRT